MTSPLRLDFQECASDRFRLLATTSDAFARAVAAFNLPDGTLIADFGCGSCGLTLPLAWAFPRLQFVGIDIKQTAMELMDARAIEAAMTNVRTYTGSITSFDEPIGLAIALHACGQASDEAMVHAVKHKAPYLVAPCCIGKVKFSFRADTLGQCFHQVPPEFP